MGQSLYAPIFVLRRRFEYSLRLRYDTSEPPTVRYVHSRQFQGASIKMPDISTVLKQEITRLAKKELKPIAGSQSKQIQALKATVRDLKGQIAAIQKSLTNTATPQPSPPEQEDEQGAIRISPTSIKKHRKRLRLSQAQLGKLLGVSTTTIVFWETGRSSPSGTNREHIAELREMGLREAKSLLETI